MVPTKGTLIIILSFDAENQYFFVWSHWVIISKNPSGTPWLPDSTDGLESVNSLLSTFAVDLTLSIMNFGLVLWIVMMPENLRQKWVSWYSQFLPECLREKPSDQEAEPGCMTKCINRTLDKWTNGQTELWKERIKLAFKYMWVKFEKKINHNFLGLPFTASFSIQSG